MAYDLVRSKTTGAGKKTLERPGLGSRDAFFVCGDWLAVGYELHIAPGGN